MAIRRGADARPVPPFAPVQEIDRGPRMGTGYGEKRAERHPLFTAVLPDSDGVLRAGWRTEPTPSDRDWAFLKTLRRGQICTGTVTEIADFGVTFVDLGGFTPMINIPELSWRHVDHPSDVVTVGETVSAEILDVDLVSERVTLSLKALQEDPMPQFLQQVGQTVTGLVTRLVPFGAFVRIENREGGLTVRIVGVDPPRRRITLSHLQARASGES
ncbi:S1 RNA-binding domain-containing protein [Streptomyces aureus]|uniref:S1 RNA-binding domain-containing protein n=1 Tax=Streptomyces aureus TaxID=193461 RepID=UPI0006E1D5B5|nr:S1 RNA-binding domain-containing protein [Streptomyces aureus]